MLESWVLDMQIIAVIAEASVTQRDAAAILESVYSFYSDAFNSLLQLTIAVIAVVGVIVPLLLGWFQNRQARIENASMRREIDSLVSEKVVELRALLKEELSKGIAEYDERMKVLEASFREELTKKSERVTGGIFQVQGNMLADAKHYPEAVESMKDAVESYCKSRELYNLQRVLNVLEETCIPRFDKTTFDEVDELESNINAIIDNVSALEVDHLFDDQMRRFKRLLAEAKKKERKGDQE